MRPEAEIQVIERLASRYTNDYLFEDLVEHFTTDGVPIEVWPIALELGIHLDDVEVRYCGKWDNLHSFGLDRYAKCGLLRQLPEGAAGFFDFEKYGESLKPSVVFGHYFIKPEQREAL